MNMFFCELFFFVVSDGDRSFVSALCAQLFPYYIFHLCAPQKNISWRFYGDFKQKKREK